VQTTHLLGIAVTTKGHARLGSTRCRKLGRGNTETIAVSEEKNTLALTLSTLRRLDPLAPPGAVVHGLEESNGAILDVAAVVLTHDGLDSLSSLVGVVEGDGRDVVVEDVGLDDTVEKVTADEAKLAVDGGSGSASKGPGVGVVVRERRVGVLEEGDGDKPVVDPKVGKEVPDEEVLEAEVLVDEVESSAGQGETKIRQEDQLLVLALVQRAGGVEVVDTTEKTVTLTLTLALGLLVMVGVTGDVGDDVKRPAEELLQDHVGSGSDGGLLHQLGELVNSVTDSASVDLTGLGKEDHVALHVTSGLVVLAVRDLPREVRDEKSRVENPANGVVEGLGGREGLVTTLVCNNPKTGTEQALEDGVEGPETSSNGGGGNVLGSNKVVSKSESGSEADNVAGNVVETGGSGALEAVSRDSITDLLDGVVGDLELVAVGIDQRTVLALHDLTVDRAH
jgi:hypothetical protein